MALISITDDSGQTHSIVTPAQQAAPDPAAPIASVPEPVSSQSPAPEELASNVAEVVPPPVATDATPVAPAAPAAHPDTSMGKSGERTPEQAVQAALAVAPPIVKDTTSKVLGRKASDVQRSVGAIDAATAPVLEANKAKAEGDERRQNASLDSQVGYNTQQAENQQQLAQDAANRKAKLQDKLNKIADESDAQVDPDRFVENLGTGGKIAMAILAAVSGFAQGGSAAISHTATPTDNPVVNMLKSRIAADIEAQKVQIESGRIRKGNILANLREQLGDEKTAEAMATSLMNQAVANKAMLTAQKLGLQGQALDNAKVLAAGIMQNASMAKDQALTTGETRIQTHHEVEAGKPVPGTGGEAQLKAWEIYQKAIDAGADPTKAYQQSGLAALKIAQPTGQTKEQRAEAIKAAEHSDEQGRVGGAIAGVNQFATAAKMSVNGSTGEYRPPAGKKPDDSLPEEGAWSWDPRFWKWGDKPIAHAKARAAAALEAAGVKNADDVLTAKTYGELADALNTAKGIVSPRLSTQDRSAPLAPAQFGGKPVQ